MKKTIIILFLLLGQCSMFNFQCSMAYAQDLYIGSFYVTSTTEESQFGDGNDKWSKRMPIIYDMFNFEQPDVLGLQSLTETQLTSLSKRMTNYLLAGDILYNKTLQLDTCGIVTELPEGSTCSWARLQKDGKPFYVFNMCISTVLADAITSVVRIRSVITEINPGNLPCFAVGFLGSDETKSAYTRIVAKFNDSYTQAPANSVSADYGTVNNFDLENNHASSRYDFVFVPKTKIKVKAYAQLEYAYYTQETDGTYKRRLPSTHFPVMAKVTLE